MAAGWPSTVMVMVPPEEKLLPWMDTSPPGTTLPFRISAAGGWPCPSIAFLRLGKKKTATVAIVVIRTALVTAVVKQDGRHPR